MSGRFITCNIRQLSGMLVDIRILGAKKEAKHNSWVWVSGLAPSQALFNQFWQWKNAGHWPAKWPEYETWFKREMQEQPMKMYLDRIILRLEEGSTIALACYCQDVSICHRGIIADWVKSQGFDVTKG